MRNLVGDEFCKIYGGRLGGSSYGSIQRVLGGSIASVQFFFFLPLLLIRRGLGPVKLLGRPFSPRLPFCLHGE